ncbi:MAG TPA: FHA domain-containing protein [Gemmataceae bacterium]|jgi:tetratricopeptide (TPR) repeat protein
MLGSGWLTLRQVRAALQNGRLEEAQQLLGQPSARGHKKSWALLEQLTRGYVARGERHLKQQNLAGAWDDLVRAEQLAPTDPAARQLREELTRLGFLQLREHLEAGEPQRALECLARLGERAAVHAEYRSLEDAVKDWLLTMELADRGEFALASQMFARVCRAVPAGAGVERFRAALDERQAKFAAALPPLHEAVDQRRWRDVLPLAEAVLAVAPQHAEARQAKSRAWHSQAPETVAAGPRAAEVDTEPAESSGPPKRFLLWIDGVGGYLICLGPRVTFGQAAGGGSVDVPLLADVSRLHATVARDGEGYVVESVRPLQVNGQTVTKATLAPGDRVTLGVACQFRFLLPVPVSTSARLELVSGHRLPLSVDGILLMAETLVLGPGPQAHVPLDVEKSVMLYRHKDGLGVRYTGPFRVNGRAAAADREGLPPNATVAGPDFSFAVEPAAR